jgi:hypothetical protein
LTNATQKKGETTITPDILRGYHFIDVIFPL